MAYETHHPTTGGGYDGVRVAVIALVIPFVGPPLVLGLLWLGIWRLVGRAYPLGKRWLLAGFLLSLVPAYLASQAWGESPLAVYLATHNAIGVAAIRRFMGMAATFDPGMTWLGYLGHVLPTWLPWSVVMGTAAGWWTRPKKSPFQVREAVGIEVSKKVEKQLAKGVKHPAGGWALGLTADGRPVHVSDEQGRHHVAVCGAPGSGKTTVLRHLIEGVSPRCPVVIIDCKASRALRREVERIPGSIVWTIGGPVRWDALRGDPTELANKLLAAEQFGPNAAIYRAAAERYVQWVARALEWAGVPRDPQAIAELLHPAALVARLRGLRTLTDPAWWKANGAPLVRKIEHMGTAEKEGVAGFAARFGVVMEGAASGSLGTGPGTFALEDAVREGRTVLFSLNAAAYSNLAPKIGAWVLLDMIRLAGHLQDEGWANGGHQCYFVIDEFSALKEEGRHVSHVLARAREAGVGCVVATQGLADLAAVDRAMPQQRVQNVAVRVLLRQASDDDARAWARHGGEYEREEESRQMATGLFSGYGDTGRASTRWRREFYVGPDELRVLGTGEAVVWIAPVGRAKRWIGRVRIAPPRAPKALPAPRREPGQMLRLVGRALALSGSRERDAA